ncbi:MAG: TAXI family TRAP transporter solute-binding subunit [candidate division NC10 bacterium]|jgi:TRAP transporter TAXI family solute receptor
MRKKLLVPALVIMVGTGTTGFAAAAHAAEKVILMGGGSPTGVYYQVVLNVCKLANEKLESQGYTCVGRPALGSVFNINAIRQGLLNFGVAQSDRNFQAFNGKADWAGWAYKELRSVFSIYPEIVMLVARADRGISSVNDLRGKRVNLGNPGSGHRRNAEDVLKYYGIDQYRDIAPKDLEQHDASRALENGEIDAFFYAVGQPWEGGVKLANRTQIRMIPIDAPDFKKFVANHPYYVMTTIPAKVYQGVDKDVPTFAVKATLVTSKKESEEVVYTIVKAVFDNLDRFRQANPAFRSLQPQDMLQGLSAPLHPGALRFYTEKGWM